MKGPDGSNNLTVTLIPFNNSNQIVDNVAFDIHYTDNTWDNNNNNDYHIPVTNITTNMINDKPVQPYQYAAYIYPNPVTDHLYCEYKSNLNIKLTIKITDIRGCVIKDIITDFKMNYIDLSNIEKGVYFVTLYEKYSKQTFRKKIVVI